MSEKEAVKNSCKRIVAAARTGIILLCIVAVLIIILFLMIGTAMLATAPFCDALYFGTKEPTTYVLPDLRNLSSSEWNSLRIGTYKLSNEYYLQLTENVPPIIKLCILKRYFTRVSACVEIGTSLENNWICSPDMRPDCLPSAIVDHYFGLSLWYEDVSTTVYTIVDVDSSAVFRRHLTNRTATLSSIWYDVLDCQVPVNLTIAVIFFGSLTFICCLGCAGCCLKICWQCSKAKCFRQLRREDQDEEIAQLASYEENGDSSSERSELFNEEISDGTEMDEEAVSLAPSELHQTELSNAGQDVSSSEEEDVQVQLLPAGGASSKESLRTAVSERGHRRHGRRSRFVPTKCPRVGYFTDSTSMSGAATDVSTNDASDEDSNVEAGSCVSGRLSSSSVTLMVQEATGVGTPPPFAHFHPTTVYDHRPGVTTEPRRPPDGI